MEFEIQVVVWGRHKYVAGFNQLHVFFFLYCIVIMIRKSKKARQQNGQTKKGQTTIYKTLHKKQKIEQHEPH
jgi:hypothetical protein